MRSPELYHIGRGQQGVLICEPYKSIICKYWRFKTVREAQVSSQNILAIFYGYVNGGDFVGGNYVATINLSAELPMLESLDTISVNTFYDAANVWGVDYSSAIDDSNKIRSSAGLAANWYTPIGPLTFSFAHPITKASTDKTEGFRFNLGTSF